MKYNWEQNNWCKFTYQLNKIEPLLYQFAQNLGRINGLLETFTAELETDVIVEMMVSEAIKTSEIEGEFLSRIDVLSSIKNNLGLQSKIFVKDKRAAGIGELLVYIRNTYQEPLTEVSLLDWHKILMSGNTRINVGKWRSNSEPMQIISGRFGDIQVHFEAPPSERVPQEMQQFIAWYNLPLNTENPIKNTLIKSAIAHLYFESIHPFEDGNGRIGRALSEKALFQGVGKPVLLSLSTTIETERQAYYAALQYGQRSNEVSNWLFYFVNTILKAQIAAEEKIRHTLKKVKFFDKFDEQLNDRQRKVILKMLAMDKPFEGGMRTKKYISITKTSKATATRDLQDLVQNGIFQKKGSGRSIQGQTHQIISFYELIKFIILFYC
jgi:Fic family protein